MFRRSFLSNVIGVLPLGNRRLGRGLDQIRLITAGGINVHRRLTPSGMLVRDVLGKSACLDGALADVLAEVAVHSSKEITSGSTTGTVLGTGRSIGDSV